ncbi:unnamed protein product [Hermetia illucens]|uniref:Uncharacterized protein n=1 Tax=Hermetia illucens TaxID=343691 RepID=A0A7R8UFV1_HERIL|nr:unnamed protein product [Hermetia illucens]
MANFRGQDYWDRQNFWKYTTLFLCILLETVSQQIPFNESLKDSRKNDKREDSRAQGAEKTLDNFIKRLSLCVFMSHVLPTIFLDLTIGASKTVKAKPEQHQHHM